MIGLSWPALPAWDPADGRTDPAPSGEGRPQNAHKVFSAVMADMTRSETLQKPPAADNPATRVPPLTSTLGQPAARAPGEPDDKLVRLQAPQADLEAEPTMVAPPPNPMLMPVPLPVPVPVPTIPLDALGEERLAAVPRDREAVFSTRRSPPPDPRKVSAPPYVRPSAEASVGPQRNDFALRDTMLEQAPREATGAVPARALSSPPQAVERADKPLTILAPAQVAHATDAGPHADAKPAADHPPLMPVSEVSVETHLPPGSIAGQVAGRIIDHLAAPKEAEPAAAPSAAPPSKPAPAHPLTALRIVLHPPEMGSVVVRLRLAETKLGIRIDAHETQAVRQLQADRDHIAKALSSSGYEVDSVEVRAADAGHRTFFEPARNPETAGGQPGGTFVMSSRADEDRADGRSARRQQDRSAVVTRAPDEAGHAGAGPRDRGRYV